MWVRRPRISSGWSSEEPLTTLVAPEPATHPHQHRRTPPGGQVPDLEMPQHLDQVPALVQHPLALTELPHRLLRSVSMSLHSGHPPILRVGRPQQVDHYPGLTSPAQPPAGTREASPTKVAVAGRSSSRQGPSPRNSPGVSPDSCTGQTNGCEHLAWSRHLCEGHGPPSPRVAGNGVAEYCTHKNEDRCRNPNQVPLPYGDHRDRNRRVDQHIPDSRSSG
jgi:hypothetical protein